MLFLFIWIGFVFTILNVYTADSNKNAQIMAADFLFNSLLVPSTMKQTWC